jgi:predicted DNA-binding transcriptional regulator AlpA
METVGRVTESAGRHTSPRGDRMLQTRDVCAHFGVSDRTVDRWVADEHMSFPQPTRIRGRKYWSESKVIAWARKRAKAAREAPTNREAGTEKAAAP